MEEVDEAALHFFLSTYRVTRQPDDTAGYGLPRKAAASAVRHTDSRRRNYYENYTKQNWCSIEPHQLLLNVSKLGMERTVELICGLYNSELFDK